MNITSLMEIIKKSKVSTSSNDNEVVAKVITTKKIVVTIDDYFKNYSRYNNGYKKAILTDGFVEETVQEFERFDGYQTVEYRISNATYVVGFETIKRNGIEDFRFSELHFSRNVSEDTLRLIADVALHPHIYRAISGIYKPEVTKDYRKNRICQVCGENFADKEIGGKHACMACYEMTDNFEFVLKVREEVETAV